MWHRILGAELKGLGTHGVGPLQLDTAKSFLMVERMGSFISCKSEALQPWVLSCFHCR